MRIAYFTSHIYETDFVSAEAIGTRPNPAGQNFHEKVIKALSKFAEVDVYSYVPMNLVLEGKDFKIEGNITYHYVKTSKYRFARALFGPSRLAGRASKSSCDVVFYDSLNRSVTKAALNCATVHHCPSVAILTDHPTNITGLGDAYCNSLLTLTSRASACFALTPRLVEAFGFQDKPHYVQPVLIDIEPVEPYSHPKPYIYFGGALFVKDGLSDLIGAYLTTHPNYDLIIAGHGPYENEIRESARRNSNIVFLGQVGKKEHLSLIKGCAFAINPRRYDKGIDDYAVPSKVMEYLCYAPCVASTKSTPLMEHFRTDINWINEGTAAFFRQHVDTKGEFNELKKNAAMGRIESEFGLDKTAADLQEFLKNLVAK